MIHSLFYPNVHLLCLGSILQGTVLNKITLRDLISVHARLFIFQINAKTINFDQRLHNDADLKTNTCKL